MVKDKVKFKEALARIKKGIAKKGRGAEKTTERSLKNISSALAKSAKTKMKSRRVMKKSSVDVRISDYKAPSILGDPNRFFKDELEETKKSMFLQ